MTTWDLEAVTGEVEVPQAPAVLVDRYVPPIVVLITSAPHRRASLDACLAAIAKQTLRPTLLLITLDGTGGDEIDFRGAHVERRTEPRGPGARWAHPGLWNLREDAIVVTIDDDIAIEPTFLERTVALVIERAAVITWHGWRVDIGEGGMHVEARSDIDCCPFGVGAAAFRWRWVRDFAASRPWAMLPGGPAADDDALLALWLWQRGVRVIRPRGRAPLAELPTSRAPDAGFLRYGHWRHGQRLALALAFDAPICGHHFPPPASVLDGFWHTIDTYRSSITDGVLRAAIHRAMSPHDMFWVQLRDALFALGPNATVIETEVGPWSYWLDLYCAVRRINLYTVCTIPQLAARLPQIAPRIDGGVLLERDFVLTTTRPDVRMPSLEVVAPYMKPLTDATRRVELR